MRPDQIATLKALAEKLADTFIVEADPDNWSGNGKLPADMSRDERGDRHWDRKGAMGTGAVLRYTLDAANYESRVGVDLNEAEVEAELDAKIREAQKRASAALSRVMDKAKGKEEYDKRVHGRS